MERYIKSDTEGHSMLLSRINLSPLKWVTDSIRRISSLLPTGAAYYSVYEGEKS